MVPIWNRERIWEFNVHAWSYRCSWPNGDEVGLGGCLWNKNMVVVWNTCLRRFKKPVDGDCVGWTEERRKPSWVLICNGFNGFDTAWEKLLQQEQEWIENEELTDWDCGYMQGTELVSGGIDCDRSAAWVCLKEWDCKQEVVVMLWAVEWDWWWLQQTEIRGYMQMLLCRVNWNWIAVKVRKWCSWMNVLD